MLPVYLAIIACIPVLTEEVIGPSAILIFLGYLSLLWGVQRFLGKYHGVISYPLFLCAALVLPYSLLVGVPLGYQNIASLWVTDANETLELMRSEFAMKYIALFALIVLSPLLVARYWKAPSYFMQRIPAYVLFVVAIVCCITVLLGPKRDSRVVAETTRFHNHYPVEMITYFKKSWIQRGAVIESYYQNHFDVPLSKNIRPIQVLLVVGESVRKEAMQVYGHPLRTTPFFSKLQTEKPKLFLAYNHAISAAAFTRVSVPSIVSLSTAEFFTDLDEFPTIYRILNANKVSTVAISNQENHVLTPTLQHALFAESNVMEFLPPEEPYDEELLPRLQKYLDLDEGKANLITMHLAGSHYEYSEKYPDEQQCFVPVSDRSNYLSSVRYTDFVFEKIYGVFEGISKPTILVYTADHGEYVDDSHDGIYGHGYKNLTWSELEVPFVFLFNQAFVDTYPELWEQLHTNIDYEKSHDNISHTILGILGVTGGEYYQSSYDLSSRYFKETPRYVVDRLLDTTALADLKVLNTYSKTQWEGIVESSHCSEGMYSRHATTEVPIP